MRILVLVWFDDECAMMKSLCTYIRSLNYEIKLFGSLNHVDNVLNDMKRLLNNFVPDICIIWNRYFSVEAVKLVKQTNPKCINKFFNWDPPVSIINGEVDKICKECDEVYVSDMGTRKLYENFNLSWSYLLPFYDKNLHYPDYDSNYECDVAFVTTNLYSNYVGNQVINREKLVNYLYSQIDIKFHLYGPKHIGNKYPRAYRGSIPYEINRKVFSSAKINLNPHGDSGDRYLNERNITILASGGLMLVDNSKGVYEELEGACILMKNTIPEIIVQIREILSNYDKYRNIRDSGLKVAIKYQTEKWVNKILSL